MWCFRYPKHVFTMFHTLHNVLSSILEAWRNGTWRNNVVAFFQPSLCYQNDLSKKHADNPAVWGAARCCGSRRRLSGCLCFVVCSHKYQLSFSFDATHFALHCMSAQPQAAFDPAVDAVTLGSEDCPRCHNPDNSEYRPPQSGQHAVGDICAIHETPTTPVHIATGHTPPYRGPALATRGLGRPAVVLRSARKARRNAQRARQTECLLCLLATFGHEGDITKLSQILQFFSVPVYPHHMLSECSRLPPHVHTSPEWCEHNAWLFAFAFSSPAAISGRWENRGAPSRPPSSYRLDENSHRALVDTCEQKRAEWEELIKQNPGLAEKWFQEYQVRRVLMRSRM